MWAVGENLGGKVRLIKYREQYAFSRIWILSTWADQDRSDENVTPRLQSHYSILEADICVKWNQVNLRRLYMFMYNSTLLR